jgi:hypothetical protein
MATHRVISSAKARSLDRRLHLELSAAIPAQEKLGDLAALPRLRSFYAHQVSRKRSE